jgi:hypothetical protein
MFRLTGRKISQVAKIFVKACQYSISILDVRSFWEILYREIRMILEYIFIMVSIDLLEIRF